MIQRQIATKRSRGQFLILRPDDVLSTTTGVREFSFDPRHRRVVFGGNLVEQPIGIRQRIETGENGSDQLQHHAALVRQDAGVAGRMERLSRQHDGHVARHQIGIEPGLAAGRNLAEHSARVFVHPEIDRQIERRQAELRHQPRVAWRAPMRLGVAGKKSNATTRSNRPDLRAARRSTSRTAALSGSFPPSSSGVAWRAIELIRGCSAAGCGGAAARSAAAAPAALVWSAPGSQTRAPDRTRRPARQEPPTTPLDQHHRQP